MPWIGWQYVKLHWLFAKTAPDILMAEITNLPFGTPSVHRFALLRHCSPFLGHFTTTDSLCKVSPRNVREGFGTYTEAIFRAQFCCPHLGVAD